jgi:type II secretory pathway component PulF
MPQLDPRDLDRLTSELASLVRTGIPMPQGLRRLSTDLSTGHLRTLVNDAAAATERGEQLSDAIAKSQVGVPPEFIAFLKCAESSGDSHALLDFAVEHGRRVSRHREFIASAIFYPCILMIALVCIALFHAQMGQGKQLDIFTQVSFERGSALTRMAMTFGEFMRSTTGYTFSGLFIALFAAPLVSRRVRNALLKQIEHMPLVEGLVVTSDTALWSKFVGAMLAKGVPVPLALSAASMAVSSSSTRRALTAMARTAEQGAPLSNSLPKSMPTAAAYIFRQGEERGSLASACTGISDYCEDRFDLLSRRASALLEPVLLVIVGVSILVFLVVSYAPLFDFPKLVG